MKNIDILYDIININSKNYKIVEYEQRRRAFVFKVQGKRGRSICPGCGKKTNKKQDLRKHIGKTPLKHIWLSDERELQILPIKRYFRCEKCRCSFLERFDFEAETGLHTKLFEEYVVFARGHMSGQQIARNTSCSGFKIHKILSNIDKDMLHKEGMKHMNEANEIYLGIDEHSFHGRDMVLVICDIKAKKVITVLPDNRQETLKSRLHSLSNEIRTKIIGVSTDMHKTYLHTVKSIIPYVLSTIDKYHLIQEANRMVDDTRQLNKWLLKMNFGKVDDIIKTGKVPKIKGKKGKIKGMKKYKEKVLILNKELFTEEELTNQVGKKTEFKEITYDFFINSGCNYRTLLWKREKNLSGIQRLRLRQIFREFDYEGYLFESWDLKERFSDALEDKDYGEIKKVMYEGLESEHYRIQAFGRTLKRWKTELKNYCLYSTKEFGFTNAFTEATNNQCKITKKVSHGFRHKDNYLRKLSSRFVIEVKKHPKKSYKGK